MHRLKSRLLKGEKVIGPFMKLTSPALVEIFGLAGFDFMIIDAEHGPFNMETAENLIRAAELVKISSIVRVRSNDGSLISRALDLGAEGIIVPQVTSAEDARAVVRAARFAPEGERGVCRYVRASGYTHEEKYSYFKRANRETVVIIIIEGAEGVENLDEILKLRGIDSIFIGPYDLSQSLGLPGQIKHSLVVQKMQQVVERARDANIAVGTFVEDIASAREWMEMGVQFIAYRVDTGIIYQAAREIVEQVKQD